MNELIQALLQVQEQTGIDKEVVFQALESSMLAACEKHFGTSANISVSLDRTTGEFKVMAQKTVVETVTDPATEISLQDAVKIDSRYQFGDVCQLEVTPKNISRIAAQKAKGIVIQRIHEAERNVIYEEYKGKEQEMVSGLIQRRERGNVYLNLDDRIEAVLSPKEQIVGEEYPLNKRLRVYVLEVKNQTRGAMVIVSRTAPQLIKRLMEQEVPEVHDGIVVIKSIAREAGSRSKVAVYSKDPMVDPTGACVGPNGNRVNTIVRELNGEKIDIVVYNQEPARFISAALSPAEVNRVDVNKEEKTATVIVPDHQLSLAIGKEGQNARLAARLTGYKIDIKSESQADEPEDEYEFDLSDFEFEDLDEE